MKSLTCYFYILVAILSLYCQSKNENIQLLLNLPIGSEQIIIHETKTTGSLISLDLYKELSLKVNSFNHNIYQYSLDLNVVKSRSTINGKTEIYDSTKDESKMTEEEINIHSRYEEMLDSNFKISTDKYGKVIRPFSFTSGKLAPEGLFEFANYQLVYPYKNLTLGSKWESQRKHPVSNMTIQVTHELKHISEDKLYIGANHVIPSDQKLMNSNTIFGDYIINRQTGQLIEAKLTMKLQTGGVITNTFALK